MFLKHLIFKSLKSTRDKGFTLIELLVTILIVGILSAIALPSFLNQTAKAKQTEAKTTISTVNAAQNAFRNENTGFAPDMKSLTLGLPTDTANYLFDIVGNQDTATIVATPKDSALRGYAGGNVRYGGVGESAIASIICQTKIASADTPIIPALDISQATPETAAKCVATQEKL